MIFCVIHLDPPCATPDEEEVYVVVPDAGKTAIALALDALPQFLPLLAQAAGDRPTPQCTACMAALPNLACVPSPDQAPGQSG